MRSEPRVLRRERRILRRQLRVCRHELHILRRQCVDRSGVPAPVYHAVTRAAADWKRLPEASRCWRVVGAARGAYRVAFGARCAQLRHPRLEVGQAEASLLLGEQRS